MVYGLKYLLLLTLVAATGFSVAQAQKPATGFWAMEGNLITHHFKESADSLSGPELYELQHKNGLPVWFGRHIYKDVCMSGVCKMIRLWLFWDGAGNYLGMHIPENEPLTKSDHTLFGPADYKKLEQILQDTASVLQKLKQEDLIVVPDTINTYEVDGYTAATQPTLAEAVVSDAVYTCHTLWHTVYGPVQDTILELLNARVNEDFLEKMFSSPKTEYILWAINALERHPDYHQMFYPEVVNRIASDDLYLSKKALDYFQPSFLNDTAIQVQLVKVMDETDVRSKYEILWKLTGVDRVSEAALIMLLEMFRSEKIGVGAYNLILRLVNEEHLNKNKQINQLIHGLSEHENAYIRNLTLRKLE